ncbi:hydrolase Nlp/P60 [Xylanibacillus composti]|uniref:Hydrolase Nlp/P60 n=1 Tax=Xylanibacillus composti TaxID=1572762 RepID=A0A8J4H6R5_9BACL|nr:SH3 domain-containing C40 family peptidase [Xylanibacillus composti]MDT9724495.1 hydrolase Nlp/P60 [Xylanibacillus composti]GIQ69758.1 hypothetical protein XYCOK13_25820 [Xylanibacillus composti]
MNTSIGKLTISAALLISSLGLLADASEAETADSRIVKQVSFREEPSVSGKLIRYLENGEQVEIVQQASSYWYKVKDSEGKTGFVSSKEEFIETDYVMTQNSDQLTGNKRKSIEDVIAEGKSYWGTPYEFGSNRNSTRTFDCSDFVRRSFIEAIGLYLPTDSRKQASYVKDLGNLVHSLNQLKRGDLVFFMDYQGSNRSDYAGINRAKQRVTHVGIYLGNGEMLHTYSENSGGVRIDSIEGAWEYRFLYGGSVF